MAVGDSVKFLYHPKTDDFVFTGIRARNKNYIEIIIGFLLVLGGFYMFKKAPMWV